MPYITKRSPTPRAGDTPIGKVMGYLAELAEYTRWEALATSVDAVFPDWFPLGTVQGLLIAVCDAIYAALYQKAYNSAADRGNEINSQILGWLDDLKLEVQTYIDQARNRLQTLIDDLDARVKRLEGIFGLALPTMDIAKEARFFPALFQAEQKRKGVTEKEAEMRVKGEMVGERAEAPTEPKKIPKGGVRR